MRVVVDTNVFISAALKENSWPGLVVRWLGSNGGLLKSAAAEQEIMEVLARPRLAKRISPAFMMNLRLLFSVSEDVEVKPVLIRCRDPKDDKFLELAVNGRADVIVSGDADLLVLGRIEDIPIVNPATFARDFI